MKLSEYVGYSSVIMPLNSPDGSTLGCRFSVAVTRPADERSYSTLGPVSA